MPPERVVDVLALVGDAVDNVPGVPGIGDKGARDLVREFGSLEEVLDERGQGEARGLPRGAEGAPRRTALLSKRLVTLRTDVPVTLELEALRAPGAGPRGGARALHASWSSWPWPGSTRPRPRHWAPTHARGHDSRTRWTRARRGGARRPGSVALWLRAHVAASRCARASWASASRHEPGRRSTSRSGTRRWRCPSRRPARRSLALLRPLFEDPTVAQAQRARQARPRAARPPRASTLRGPGLRRAGRVVPAQPRPAQLLRSRTWRSSTWASGRGAEPGALSRARGGVAARSPRRAARGAGGRPRAAPRRARARAPGGGGARRRSSGRWSCRWSSVLAEMERAGVKVDTALPRRHEPRHGARRSPTLTREIHALAGGEFNINSPIQLREVLFDRLGLQERQEDGQDPRRLHRGGGAGGAGPRTTSCRGRSSSTARCRS